MAGADGQTSDTDQNDAIIESMSATAYLLDSSLNIASTNRESLPQTDVSIDSFVGDNVMDLIEEIVNCEEDATRVRNAIDAATDENPERDFPVTVGVETDAAIGTTTREYRCAPFDMAGETGVLIVSEEPGDPETQELERYKQLCDTLTVAVAITTNEADGGFEFVNQAAVDLFGADSKQELNGHTLCDRFAEPRDREQYSEQMTANGATEEYEAVLLTLDGDAFWGSVTATVTEINGQEHTIGVIKDITERKQNQRELREERALIDGIVDSLPDIFYTFDTDGSLVEYNEELRTATGYDQQELETMAPWEFVPETEQGKIIDAINRLIDSKEDIDHLEAHLLTKSGDEIPYAFSVSPLFDADGTVIGVTGVGRDITDRRKRERKLEQHREVIQAVDDAVYLLDERGHFELVNDALTEFTGYSREELLGKHTSVIKSDAVVEEAESTVRSMVLGDRTDDEETFELEIQRADGTEFPAEDHMVLLWDDDHERFTGTAGIIRDITERKQNEEMLQRQNERLEKFASMISHDLRNPISVAEGYVDFAERTGDEGDFQKVRDALGRMERMISGMLTMATAETIVEEREPLELAVLSKNAWETAQTGGATLEIETESQQTIYGDRDLLLNVFENLFRNAVDHNEPPLTIRVGTLDGDRSGFYIADNGTGIPEDEREVIFEHGYTTSHDGTGFGLDIVSELITAHGWLIRVTAGRDGGARFEINTDTDNS
ncbi:MAG: PAS sensor histidine kinase [Halonotius sp. J07HN4]|nr:MAG: PAS sensor histidine kinase [Halonotius sp. J07HN4]